MSNRQEDILNHLRSGRASSEWLAKIINAPIPSVRRDVQALRSAGYDIRNVNGSYRLFSSL